MGKTLRIYVSLLLNFNITLCFGNVMEIFNHPEQRRTIPEQEEQSNFYDDDKIIVGPPYFEDYDHGHQYNFATPHFLKTLADVLDRVKYVDVDNENQNYLREPEDVKEIPLKSDDKFTNFIPANETEGRLKRRETDNEVDKFENDNSNNNKMVDGSFKKQNSLLPSGNTANYNLNSNENFNNNDDAIVNSNYETKGKFDDEDKWKISKTNIQNPNRMKQSSSNSDGISDSELKFNYVGKQMGNSNITNFDDKPIVINENYQSIIDNNEFRKPSVSDSVNDVIDKDQDIGSNQFDKTYGHNLDKTLYQPPANTMNDYDNYLIAKYDAENFDKYLTNDKSRKRRKDDQMVYKYGDIKSINDIVGPIQSMLQPQNVSNFIANPTKLGNPTRLGNPPKLGNSVKLGNASDNIRPVVANVSNPRYNIIAKNISKNGMVNNNKKISNLINANVNVNNNRRIQNNGKTLLTTKASAIVNVAVNKIVNQDVLLPSTHTIKKLNTTMDTSSVTSTLVFHTRPAKGRYGELANPVLACNAEGCSECNNGGSPTTESCATQGQMDNVTTDNTFTTTNTTQKKTNVSDEIHMAKQINDFVRKILVHAGKTGNMRKELGLCKTYDKEYTPVKSNKHIEDEIMKGMIKCLNKVIAGSVKPPACGEMPPELVQFLDWLLLNGISARDEFKQFMANGGPQQKLFLFSKTDNVTCEDDKTDNKDACFYGSTKRHFNSKPVNYEDNNNRSTNRTSLYKHLKNTILGGLSPYFRYDNSEGNENYYNRMFQPIVLSNRPPIPHRNIKVPSLYNLNTKEDYNPPTMHQLYKRYYQFKRPYGESVEEPRYRVAEEINIPYQNDMYLARPRVDYTHHIGEPKALYYQNAIDMTEHSK